MNYHAKITIREYVQPIYDCLISEIHEEDRTSIKLLVKQDVLEIDISCLDATAMRAACNSILRLVSVFEKTNATTIGGNDHHGKNHSERNAGKNKSTPDG
jgi:tRNA threonylcarbamoyladenosine modification (KEOPS) complex  Pcc1 subunit